MDSFKTGEFIKSLRSEKGLTQKELAESLNCTDKAISRWETGKGFPDIVFLAPLAKTLGVTVNELLAGERLSPEELVLKSDEAILNTMKEAENNRQKVEKIIFAVVCFVSILINYLFAIFGLPIDFLGYAILLCVIICIFVGLLKVKIKFVFPLIMAISYIPVGFIRQGFDFFGLYSVFLIASATLFFGLVIICIVSAIKGFTKGVYRKWKGEDKITKVLSAITIVCAIVLGCVGIGFYEKDVEEVEKIQVVEFTINDETHIDELEYNGTTYYSCDNYISQYYKDILDEGEFVSQRFPRSMEPYSLDLQRVDLSNCIEFLPNLPDGQEYSIEKEAYYIYAKDSITKPSMIYACGDSYEEWFISEDFDFTMPTIETHNITDIVVYERYGGNFICITDEEKISEIITIKNNREDISKYVTTEEYGDWFDIRIRYDNSPFTERIGVLREDGTFVYTESLQEKYEENPYWYYSLEYETPYWSNFS